MSNSLPEPVVIERTLNAPTSVVWKALTDIEVLQKWLSFFPAFKAEVGFETRFELGPEGREYMHICQVTEVEHERKLTYSWRYEGYSGDAYVTFALEPQGDMTLLTLTYRITEAFPLDNPDFAPENARQGWSYTADALKEFVELQN
ncbi:MAG: SRPBCC domain-containing protein [Enhydrobacter sp.]|nr:SRPBCC domain-containing protein [Enhydrobacter sp.]